MNGNNGNGSAGAGAVFTEYEYMKYWHDTQEHTHSHTKTTKTNNSIGLMCSNVRCITSEVTPLMLYVFFLHERTTAVLDFDFLSRSLQ